MLLTKTVPYLKWRFLSILILGFVSGSAFVLVTSTIPLWLSIEGYSPHIVGRIFLATVPYSLKFLWAPLFDNYLLPGLGSYLGQRRGWALIIQIGLVCSVLLLGSIALQQDLWLTAGCSLLVSLFAASQDIVLDAYRIERLSPNELAIGTVCSGTGFRLGMLVSGALALYLTTIYDWQTIYRWMAVLMLLGPVTILLSAERTPVNLTQTSSPLALPSPVKKFPGLQLHFRCIKECLQDFFKRPNWAYIILFIVFYKASDAIPNAMSGPLLVDLSFSPTEIASVSKTFGVMWMIIGGLLGGFILTRCNPTQGLIFCGSIQLLAPLGFMLLAFSEHNLAMLTSTIAIQNIGCGIGSTAFVVYLSSLCQSKRTATEFSLLYSFSSLVRILLSSYAGWLTQYLDWSLLFFYTALFSTLFLVTIRKIA